jgi:putative ABC transport system ATP-binding protein
MSHEVMQLLRQLNRERGITIVMVSHEPEMMAYTDRIARFRDGRIEATEENRPDVGEAS